MDNKKIDVLEISAVVFSLLFAITISQYHIAYDGFRGLTTNQWNEVWAIAENSFNLLMISLIVILVGSGMIRLMFSYVFIPYFILKAIYHYSVFFQVYLISAEWWKTIWSYGCVFLLVSGLLYCLSLIRKIRKNVAKVFKF